MNENLTNLGLSPFFTQQLSMDELDFLVRVIEVQRSHIVVSDGTDEWKIALGGVWFKLAREHRPTVGDWVLLDESRDRILRLLERKSVFKRVAAGNKVDMQLLAANVDTLFIVTSCNEEFNESRLERYLALAIEAGVDPVVILTKADLTEDVETYRERVKSISPDISVDSINATDPSTFKTLKAWVTPGSTVALVGSSGVGKSTILNSLSETQRAETGAIREQDSRGRHTTSFRSLHRLAGGGILLDVPGIRELKVAQLDTSLDDLFEDIDGLTKQCKFSDCSHQKEPGCAVLEAISNNTLDQRRFDNFQKLVEVEQKKSASLVDKKVKNRKFTRTIKQHLALKKKNNKK
jgi:ribosome biogenesis GTPase